MMPHDRIGCDAARHGNRSAYWNYGCRCPDAREANRLYRKRAREGRQPPERVDATGTQRRLSALMAMGWTQHEVELRLRWAHDSFSQIARSRTVYRSTAKKVAALYDQLAMTPGPSNSGRIRAHKAGRLPPLAWNNIDDPAEQPDTGTSSDTSNEEPDPVAVQRAMSGRLPAAQLTTRERQLAVAGLLADGLDVRAVARRLHAPPSTIRRVTTRLNNPH